MVVTELTRISPEDEEVCSDKVVLFSKRLIDSLAVICKVDWSSVWAVVVIATLELPIMSFDVSDSSVNVILVGEV